MVIGPADAESRCPMDAEPTLSRIEAMIDQTLIEEKLPDVDDQHILIYISEIIMEIRPQSRLKVIALLIDRYNTKGWSVTYHDSTLDFVKGSLDDDSQVR
jgi:hypothetical protein